MKAYKGRRVTAPLILTFRTTRM